MAASILGIQNINQLKIKDLSSLMSTPKATLNVNDSIARTMQIFHRQNIPCLTMVDNQDKVIGMLRKDTVLEYCYNLLSKTTGITGSRYELAYHTLEDFVQHTSPVLSMNDTVKQIIDFILNTGFNIFPVVDENNKLIGTIGCRDLLEGHADGTIEITKKS